MTSRARRATVISATLALAALAATGVGCSGPVHQLRMNPTPEVVNLTDSKDEAVNDLFITADMNWRMITEDAARALHLNRPSRLSPAPIPR